MGDWSAQARRVLKGTAAFVLVSGVLGRPDVAQAQAFDPAFTTAVDGLVKAVAIQPDGKILIGGDFSLVNGVTRRRLARLNADGSLDAAFTTDIPATIVTHDVSHIGLLPDGRIVIAGGFAQVGSVAKALIACLLPDGTVDTSFAATVPDLIQALFVQPDGKIVIGGRFLTVNGVARSRVARLNADGTLDGTFAPAVTGFVYTVARQADGSLLLGGAISAVDGVARSGVARVAAGGALDTSFSPVIDRPNAEWIEALAVRPDGRILIGGAFETVNGVSRPHLAQLNVDGSLDTGFDARPDSNQAVNNGFVHAMVLQPDGRLVFGGRFLRVNGIPTYSVARVLADGALDYTFGVTQSGAFTETLDLARQTDGKIVIGGDIGTREVARLLATAPLDSDPRLTMTSAPEPVAPGGTLTLTLTATNAGTTPASGISVTTVLPAGLAFVACTAAGGGTCGGSGSNRTVTYPAIPGNEARTMTLVTTVTAGSAATLVTTATLTAQSPDTDPGNNAATATAHTTAAATADVEVTMTSAPPQLDTGGQVAFTVGVRNNGTVTAANVVVTDTLSAGLSFVSCTATGATCAGAGASRTIAFGGLAGGQARTITIVAAVTGQAGATVSNAATAATTTSDAVPANNAASITVRVGDFDGDDLSDAWESRYGLNPTSSEGVDGAAGDPDGDGLTNAQELARGTHPRGYFVSFLAEGAHNAFFASRLAVLNGGNAAGKLLFRFLQAGGAVTSHAVDLPERRRLTIGNEVFAGLASPDFSTVLESDQPIVLDRTMTWGGGVGSHAETGVVSPSSTWYLAEGSTSGDFALFYLLQNPNPMATLATVRYLLPFGQAPIERQYALPASSRTTIPVDAQGGVLASTDVSAVITTPQQAPIIVERAMYRSTATTPFASGHGSAGVIEPATSWFLAEGATGPFFDCFVLLANPNLQPAAVTIDYLLSDGRTFTKAYTVPGQGRVTVWVDDEQIPAGSGVRPLTNVAVSSTVTSTLPIIVERTMWWPGPQLGPSFWTEAHNSPGATVTGTSWAVAEGEVAAGTETYILIANTSPSAGRARITLYFDDGANVAREFALLARSRRTVNASTDFPASVGRRFAAVIESLGAAPVPIVVERAMYASPGGAVWEAGTNALATRLSVPPPSRLEITATPDPVAAAASPACLPGTIRNWWWNVSVRNTGATPFVVTSFEVTNTVPGAPPLVTQGTAGEFAAMFGTSTIAPGTTVQTVGAICNGLTFVPSGVSTVSTLVRGQAGESVRSPTVRLLP